MGRPNNDLVRQRNEAIFRDWQELCSQHLKTDYALETLKQKYYLERETIYKIVRNVTRNGF